MKAYHVHFDEYHWVYVDGTDYKTPKEVAETVIDLMYPGALSKEVMVINTEVSEALVFMHGVSFVVSDQTKAFKCLKPLDVCEADSHRQA